MNTIIKITYGSDVGFVRCNLAQASSPIEVSADGDNWDSTQYQCPGGRRQEDRLAQIGWEYLWGAHELPDENGKNDYDWEVLE